MSPEINKLKRDLMRVENKDSILRLIRKAIKDKPLDTYLLERVNSLMRDSIPYRFRSSSNAEDLPGFNGAGLYTSTRGVRNQDIEKAIKKVWASVYSEEAYAERQQYHIDESTVSMAILIHEGFPDEEANGVAVTKNLYRPSYSGFTINVQYGETSVVQPDDRVICDQMILIPEQLFKGSGSKVYAQYITRSNIKPGVLNSDELYDLYFALEFIKTYFYNKAILKNKFIPYEDFGLDIEFKFDDGQLYIKQVRPYK
jgi:phosphoenolpyruvate synthase/pyruvate phosphate dikinase